jgi:predicted phosphodiesterase
VVRRTGALALFSGCAFFLWSCTYFHLPAALDSRFSWRDEFVFLDQPDRGRGRLHETFSDDSFSFIVISDTHIPDNPNTNFSRLNPVLEPTDKFVVITGDITGSGTREQLSLFLDHAAELNVPCYPVAGNHDVYDDNAAPWRELIGSMTYRVDITTTSPESGATLFVLDSAEAVFGKQQLDWFERELKTAKRYAFIFTHNNFFTNTPLQVEEFTDIRERARIMFLAQGRCSAVFTGHLHDLVIKEFDGVRYYSLDAFIETGNYCRVTVTPEGTSYELAWLEQL